MPFWCSFPMSQPCARLRLRHILSSFGEAYDVDGVQEEGQLLYRMFHMSGAWKKALDCCTRLMVARLEMGNPVRAAWCMNRRSGIPFRLNGVSARIAESCFRLMVRSKRMRNGVSGEWCLQKNCGMMFQGNGVSWKTAE